MYFFDSVKNWIYSFIDSTLRLQGTSHGVFFSTFRYLEHQKTPRAEYRSNDSYFQYHRDTWKKIRKKISVDGDVVDKFSKIKPNTTQINYGKMLIFGIELIRTKERFLEQNS